MNESIWIVKSFDCRSVRMGQTLSEPVTTKETESVSNANYRVAASCMQGWRISILSLIYDYALIISYAPDVQLMSVCISSN